VDGRDEPWDEPGHDGEGSLNRTASAYPSAYAAKPPASAFSRFERAPGLSRWLGFIIRLLFAAAIIAYFVVRYLAFVPRAIQP
jgi:hypothetical protein